MESDEAVDDELLESDEVPDDDELLESDDVPDDDELQESAVEFALLELPLASDSRISIVISPEPLELPDALVLPEPPEPPLGGGPLGGPPAPPGPLANVLEKIFCNSLA